MMRRKFDNALRLFKLNIEMYPGSSNAYKSLSDYYYKMNDNKTTEKYSNEALALKKADKK